MLFAEEGPHRDSQPMEMITWDDFPVPSEAAQAKPASSSCFASCSEWLFLRLLCLLAPKSECTIRVTIGILWGRQWPGNGTIQSSLGHPVL